MAVMKVTSTREWIVIQRRHNNTISTFGDNAQLTFCFSEFDCRCSCHLVKTLHNFLVNTVFSPIEWNYFVGFYQKECGVCHLLGRSTLWMGANIKQKSLHSYTTAVAESVCTTVWSADTHTKTEPSISLAGPFLVNICVCGKFGGKRQSDMSNILHCWILFGVIALWISPSDIFSRVVLCCAVSASPFSGTYHLFRRCNVHISTLTMQWKWKSRRKVKKRTNTTKSYITTVMHLNWIYRESWPVVSFCEHIIWFIVFPCNHLFRCDIREKKRNEQTWHSR